MGMYTEFYFRANIKNGPVADWLDQQINNDGNFETAYDGNPFFMSNRWAHVFIGEGAVYQESRRPIFRRKAAYGEPCDNQLVIASSLKDYGSEIESFVEWITPHLEMGEGDFLGYELYEDTTYGDDGEWREHPVLYFMHRESVRA